MSRFLLRGALLALLLVAVSGAASDSPNQGVATQYGGRQDRSDPNTPIYGLIDGACGYGAIPKATWPFWQVAALGFSNSVSASGVPQKWGCGACIQVTCASSGCATATPFVVVVTDTCKDCAANQININALTYEKYISATNGKLPVTWQQVPCTPPGNIIAKVSAASGSYLRLTLFQVGGSQGVKSVEVSKSGSNSWIKMDQAWGANWQTSSAPSPPLDMRITPNDGSAPLVATGVITAAAPGDYDTGVQLAFPAPAGNATLAPVGPPVGPQQIPAVATANATLAPVNATSALANATAPAASASVPVTNATLLAGNNTVASVVPIAAPNATEPAALSAPAVAAPGPAAAANPTTTLALPGTGVAPRAAASAGPPVSQPAVQPVAPAAAVPSAAVPTAAVPAAPLPATAGRLANGGAPAVQAPAPVQASSQTAKPSDVSASSVPAAATPPAAPLQATPASAPVQATPPTAASAPVQATPASAPVQATPPAATAPSAAPATPPAAAAAVPSPTAAFPPPGPTASVPSPAAATGTAAASSPAASGGSSASPPQAAATSSGSAPAPVVSASGNADQPFSLNLNRATANVTGGSTAAAPSVNSAVEQILNPKVTYNSGGRRLA